MKKLKDITPEKFKCVGGVCPSIYSIKGNENQLVIVGKKLDQHELEGVNIDKEEAAVMIDQEMLEQLSVD